MSVGDSFCQNRNSVWCFGDSALIDFSDTSNIITGTSSVKSRGSCASISDASGQLLFYAYTRAGVAGNTTLVFSANNSLMQNGDSIVGEGWFYELVIIPYPQSDSLFYLFSIGVAGSSQTGLYYSIIDMSLNGGLGDVIQKNIQLQSFKTVDCLTAIKHGNGRDWWIIFRKKENASSGSNNTYYEYLITQSGLGNVIIQNIGSLNTTNSGNIEFNAGGNKMMYTNLMGLMEYYDFNRCTGIISNPQTIFPEQTGPYNRLFWDGQFSPSGDLFYTTLNAIPGFTDSCYLIQYNLNAANIPMSADTIAQDSIARNMGQIKLALDNKIYLSSVYNNFVTPSYPYPDTIYSTYNTYLGVISSPDSIGAACNFQPFSFYLGGKRTYTGLPNNPDYELGAVTGSFCDSLTGITYNQQIIKSELFVYYNSSWQKVFINAKGLKGRNAKMSVYDLLGNIIYTEAVKLSSQYFTRDLSMAAFAKGMYIVNLNTEKERLVKKFIKD
jgi:type IX secretion system substrate protein